MGSIKYIAICCRLNFLKWYKSSKIIMLILILIGLFSVYISNFRALCIQYGTKVTAWLFPFMFFPTMTLAYVFILIVLFGNSPFLDYQSYSVLSRTTRSAWIAGQILYTILAALFLMLFTIGVYMFSLIPYGYYANDWGRLFRNIVSGNVPVYTYLSFNSDFYDLFSPMSAFALYCLIHWLLNVFVGALCMFLNLWLCPGSGTIAVSILAVFSYLITIFPPFQYVAYISPFSWYNIASINFSNTASFAPNLLYVLAFLLLANMLLFGGAIRTFLHADLYSLQKEGTI